jgi:hypothetical protein
MSLAEELAPLLERAVARHLGAPGTIADLKRLTGGATKKTWSFTAQIVVRSSCRSRLRAPRRPIPTRARSCRASSAPKMPQ